MEYLVIAMLIGLIPAYIAKQKGRSFGLWWFYGAAIFIIALPHAIIMKPDNEEMEKQQLESGMKKCPFCAEFIKAEAMKCKHCGETLTLTEEEKRINELKQKGYNLLTGKDGEAFCMACQKISPVNGMYHHKETDTYYHERCLPT